jgi:hypothetical protein
MGRLGVLPMPRDESQVTGGSFIAIPKLALPHDLPADLRTMMIPVRSLSYKLDTPLRVLDYQTPAGFYSSGWGLIPFSFSNKPLEEIEVQQVSFMVERLPWAKIETSSGIKPWPDYLKLQGQALLSMMIKPESHIIYEQPFHGEAKLRMLCGVSPDSYSEGSGASHRFEVRQLDADGGVLIESHIALKPGINKEERKWQPVKIVLKPAQNYFLDFGYHSTDGESGGAGAFAQAILTPAD